MVYKNEQPRSASLCRGWAMLEIDLTLICTQQQVIRYSDEVIQAQPTHDGIMH